MTQKSWIVEAPDGRHVVELEHGYWSGKRVIKVDGVVIEQGGKLLDTGSEHRFQIGDQPCVLRIKNRMFHFEFELFVDGKLV